MKKIFNKKKFRYIILLSCILVAFLFAFSFIKTPDKRIYIENGVLDLKSWNADRDGILSLKGQWSFFWGRFLSYQEVTTDKPKSDLTVDIPSVWNNYKINGNALTGFGYGTYLLKVVNAPVGKPLAFKMPVFATAYELFINNRLAVSNGKVGIDKAHFTSGGKPEEVEFTPSEQSFELIIHVANFTYAQGGMCYTVKLGTPEQIRSMDKSIAYSDLLLIGALAIMTFYYLIIFLLWREDKSVLYSVFVCVNLAAMTAISGDYFIYHLIPSISYDTVILVFYIILCWQSISGILGCKRQ